MARRLTVMTSLVGSGGTQRQQRTKNGRKKRSVALSEGLPAVSFLVKPYETRTKYPKNGQKLGKNDPYEGTSHDRARVWQPCMPASSTGSPRTRENLTNDPHESTKLCLGVLRTTRPSIW